MNTSASKIFKHPAVQYIPLRLINSKQKRCNSCGRTVKIDINNCGTCRAKSHVVLPGNLKIFSQRDSYLQLIVYNGWVDFIKYRAYKVIMVGSPGQGYYHSFAITQKYFYKDKILFLFYNKTTEENLAREIYNLNI